METVVTLFRQVISGFTDISQLVLSLMTSIIAVRMKYHEAFPEKGEKRQLRDGAAESAAVALGGAVQDGGSPDDNQPKRSSESLPKRGRSVPREWLFGAGVALIAYLVLQLANPAWTTVDTSEPWSAFSLQCRMNRGGIEVRGEIRVPGGIRPVNGTKLPDDAAVELPRACTPVGAAVWAYVPCIKYLRTADGQIETPGRLCNVGIDPSGELQVWVDEPTDEIGGVRFQGVVFEGSGALERPGR